MTCSIDELCKKDVINVENGSRIGYVVDVEADMQSGRMSALLVSHTEKSLTFRKPECIRVDWNNIVVIGDETILVKDVNINFENKKETKRIFDIFTK